MCLPPVSSSNPIAKTVLPSTGDITASKRFARLPGTEVSPTDPNQFCPPLSFAAYSRSSIGIPSISLPRGLSLTVVYFGPRFCLQTIAAPHVLLSTSPVTCLILRFTSWCGRTAKFTVWICRPSEKQYSCDERWDREGSELRSKLTSHFTALIR